MKRTLKNLLRSDGFIHPIYHRACMVVGNTDRFNQVGCVFMSGPEIGRFELLAADLQVELATIQVQTKEWR